MGQSTQIFVFGDQTHSFESGLRWLFQRKDNVLLLSFFERTHYALRLEISKLGVHERDLFPRFTSLVDLLANYRKSTNNPALESAFTTIHQIGCFISHHEETTQAYPLSSGSLLLGTCTGLLAASAVSSAQSLSSLIPVAIEVVLIAFRTGLLAMKVRNSVESGSASSSWSVVISGIDKEFASASLEAFLTAENLPVASRPYISSVSSSSLTISGPPKSLELLFDSNAFTGLKTHKVDIHAPYHASHLYDYTDVESIISKSNFEILETGNSNIPILSSATGEVFPASEHTPLLRLILEEILLQPIRWDLVLGNCVESLKSSDISHCDVFSTATNNANSLASALREASIFSVVVNVGKTIGSEPDICGLHPGRQDQSKIAIIGLSGRFPEAPNLESFWSLLHQGLDVHKVVPTDRFDIKTHFDSTGKRKNTSQTPYGCFINEPGLFDARFFNMSPKEASQSDPGQRLALLTACEALEMAGFVPDRTPSSQRDRVGIFYGMTSDDWREVNSGQDVSTYFIPGGNRAFTPGRINYHFKFSGPSVSVDTACSSSLAAIHMACNSLWRNDCDTAIAGGTNVMTNPDNFAGLDKGHFLSRTGNCKTFDDGADGYCRADGVGSVIMKRLEDAQADGDPIQGVIVGAYTNHSAEAESITRPNIGAQSFIFDKVLNDAGVEPMSISYIEMHGTGTQAGDFVEMKSVLDVFASGPNKRSPQRPLYLGSAKSNIGHGESASGVTSLIKVLLMMKENEIPPHCGIKTKINHRFPADLEQRGIRIAKKPIPWQRDGGTRRVFLNNFSAAGGNTALLLEDAPATDDSPLPEDPRTFHMVAVSAKTIPSLTKNLRNLAAFTVLNPDMSLPDLSYTTTARRIHHDFRVIISGTSLDMISKGLETAALRRDFNLRRSSKVAFAFTGQGSQYIGMGKQLFSSFSQFRSDIQHFDKICLRSGFPSIQKLIDGSSQVDVLNPSTLQLGLTCLQMALARLWISWGVKPTFVIGHSLGEYAALNIAGVLSVHDTIYLTGKRAQLLQEKCTPGTHSMLAIKASVPFVNKLSSNHKFEYACINGPDQVVIGGLTSGIEEVSEKLAKSGIKYRTLEVPFAFHSSQVNPILEEFESVARGIRFQKPKIPLISPLLAAVITDEKINATYLSRHCREVVDFVGALEAAKNSSLVDNTIWIEIGPDPIVTSMVKTILGPSVCTIPSLRKTEDASKVLTGSLSTLYLARVDIHWDEYHRDFSHKVLQLPVYSWDLKNYWIQYVHDWCLTKGDAPSQPPVSTLVATAPRLSTTTVQKIIEENFEDDEATVTIESDISRPDLKAVFQAHRVNGVALCPSSAYADIALTLGEYLLAMKVYANASAMDICNMVSEKPLIANEDDLPQLFGATATADWTKQQAVVTIYTPSLEEKKKVVHATCIVRYGNSDEWLQEWNRNAYLVKTRIEKLLKDVDSGSSHKIKRGLAYKIFGSLVEYGQGYRGMEEVVFDSAELEATANVVFQSPAENFHTSPYWIDSLGHISGFVMNAVDGLDSKAQVFINHGWESVRCAKKLSPACTYRTYVKMQLVSPVEHIYSGDVYIFEGDSIVEVNRGVKFKGVPRKVLDLVLPPQGASKVSNKASSNAAIKTCPKSLPKTMHIVRSQENSSPRKLGRTQSENVDSSHIFSRALVIVADEIGVPVSDLKDDSAFADFGVDSLLSLAITARFREELDIEIEPSIFNDYPVVCDMKRFFPTNSSDDSYTTNVSQRDECVVSSDSSQSTPEIESRDGLLEDAEIRSNDREASIVRILTFAMAEAIGVSAEEIKTCVDFGELGMDSLMSLTLLANLKEELDMDLPSDFFSQNNTLDAIKKTLSFNSESRKSKESPSFDPLPEKLPASKEIPMATSILLQGSMKAATKKLFLFPDGSGSATSYATLPPVGADIAVLGLNCPYMKCPQDLTCTLKELNTSYLAEIRRRQPNGPYYLGGWSAGGICAYDVAQRLIEQGEKVSSLILIDSPFPIGLTKLPPRLYHFFNSIGLFGMDNKAPPDWLLPHFLAFVKALNSYVAKPFPAGTAPKTYLILARNGVYDSTTERLQPQPDDTKEMKWLLENRKDFGTNGWDQLVGDSIFVEDMKGANHFTMMKGKNGLQLSEFIRRAIG